MNYIHIMLMNMNWRYNVQNHVYSIKKKIAHERIYPLSSPSTYASMIIINNDKNTDKIVFDIDTFSY